MLTKVSQSVVRNWKCNYCGLFNSIQRIDCQACFVSHKLTREMLVCVFVRQSLKEIVPEVIILMIIDFSKPCLESNILTEEEQQYLITMIEQQPQTMKFKYSSWNLLCSGKRDGIKQKIFHDKCDGKQNTVCILDITSTGYVCGGYASTAWRSTQNYTIGKDDDAFLFVIRPIKARKVCHRKRTKYGNLLDPDCGITFEEHYGFIFGKFTFFWGAFQDPKIVCCLNHQHHFEYSTGRDIVGVDSYDQQLAIEMWNDQVKFTDFEVYQL